MEVFYGMAEAKTIVEIWRQNYNHERPHSSLGYQTPAEFAATWLLKSSTMGESPLREKCLYRSEMRIEGSITEAGHGGG
jgi:putative transposase